MIPQSEEYFPRGGSKPGPAKLTKPKQENLFGVATVDKSKVKSRKAKKEKDLKAQTDNLRTEQAHSTVADVLSYNKIKDGMLILGVVRKIKSLSLEIELPGRTYGELSVKSISRQFYRELNKRLQSNTEDNLDITKLNLIFKVGQFIPLKVLSINDTEKGMKIMLSTEPHLINSSIQHKYFIKDMLIWGCIAEKSDHAFLVDVGVKNCRVILPFDKIDDQKNYEIGEPLYCVVIKSDNLKEACTLTVSALKEDIENNTESSELSLDHIIPGMQVDYAVGKLLKDGMEGKFFNDCLGYINELYLSNPLENLGKYNPGQTIKARILYTQPTTKFTYLSLRNLDIVSMPLLKNGDTLQSKVISRAGNGIILRLNKSEKGFVTHKRILNTIKANVNNLNEIVRNKYATGTDHACRILDYSRMDRMYICTFEPSVIKEQIFTKHDLKLGGLFKGVIKEIVPAGVVLSLGNIEGFVQNMHLGNAEYSENIKKMFKVGQQCNSKVLQISSETGNVKLTMKPDLLHSDLQLCYYEEATPNKECLGVVVSVGKNGALLTFYGNVKGWLPSKEIPQLEGGNIKKMFYEGQTVKCMVKKTIEQRMTLTLEPTSIPKKKRLRPGQVYESGTITNITLLGLELIVGAKNIKVFLPKEHLCFGDLSQALLDSYKIGEEIKNIICINTDNPPIFSMREAIEFLKQDLKIPVLQQLKENVLLRCFYNKNMHFGISIGTPVINYPLKFSVDKLQISDYGDDIKFTPHQTLVAKVIQADYKTKTYKFTTKLSEVFNYDFNYSVNMLENRLIDTQNAYKRLSKHGNTLTTLKIGQSYECIINKVDKLRGCSVFILPCQEQGLVEMQHCPKDVASGTTMTCIVLSINLEHKYVSVSLKKDIINKINPQQNGQIEATLFGARNYAHILSVNDEYALGVLTNEGANKQLVYLPVRLHENDFKPNLQHYLELINRKVKIILVRCVDGLLFGFEKEMQKNLTKKAKQFKPHLIVIKKSGGIEEIGESTEALKRKLKPEEDSIKKDLRIKLLEAKAKKSVKVTKNVAKQIQVIGGDEESDSDQDEVEVKSEEEDDEDKMEVGDVVEDDVTMDSDSNDNDTEIAPILPGIKSFFKPKEDKEETVESSSDEDAEGDEPKLKKKKKLSPAERAEQVRIEEDRLRKIENDLADSSSLPQSAEQFDRILLGNPDNSEMWTRYIAFHAQSTEFEKARTVAKRALERISYSAIQDRLNVWLAYLNLENMYGTKESFDKAFDEASRSNDTLTIYLESIKMLAEMQKYTEMDEKIKKVRGKFKQDIQMWLEVGKVFYNCKRFVDARKLKDSALVTLLDKKTHVSLIVQFAIMEFNQGEQNHGEALFETIIQSDPKRVDVWSTYVDQLIKKDNIDLARNVLGRAAGQKLPYKKMRTLFKKYHNFEKTYGNKETIEHVKNLLKEYGDK